MTTIHGTATPMHVCSREDTNNEIVCDADSHMHTTSNNTKQNKKNNNKKHTRTVKREQAILEYIKKSQHTQRHKLPLQNYNNDLGFGDALTTSKCWNTGEETTIFRVGTININGISKSLQWIEWEILLRHMQTLQIDALGITEPNVNFKNKSVLTNLYEIMKRHDRHMQLSTSSSNQLLSSIKKMGGTMTVLDGRWAGRKVNTFSDSKGRWSAITIKGKRHWNITLLTAYRVCAQKGGLGSTIYHQQQIDFESDGLLNVDLRNLFCQDLTNAIRELHQRNHIVILMGDFNDDLNMNGGQVVSMLRDCGLANVAHHVHGDNTQLPSTYHRGSKCLDMIAITDNAAIPKSSIKKAGFLPFYHYFCSDHRLVFCDIDMKLLFGHIQPDLPRFIRRPFTTKNVEKCEKFKNKVRELYNKSNIFEIVENLDKRFKSATADSIDEVIADCIKYGTVASQLLLGAGRKIGHHAYSKGKPFSDQLSIAAQAFHDKRNELKHLKTKATTALSKSQEADIIRQIKQTYQDLRDTQRNATKIREAFLEKLAVKRAHEWQLSKNAALNTILQAEASRRTFERHSKVMKGGTKGSINDLVVAIPKYDATVKGTEKAGWTTITDEETIFALLLRRNTQQFMRSANCPFANGKIVDTCGIDGDGDMVDKILEGTLQECDSFDLLHEYSDPHNVLQKFISALAKPRNEYGRPIPDFEWKFGVKEFRSTFRKTRESTSCGPSGLNMSYWKACAEDDDIARVQSFFIEKAFRFGFSYPRWQVSWHCMLKKKDLPYIHRLRIIQLFEGDFNGALKYLLGRLLMYHIVNSHRCDNQAFGSIPGRTAHDALITLQLIYDNARVTKRVIASMFNDAAGCYDRIRPLLSSICMQRMGCPEPVSRCHTVTQRKMIHRVKTSKGISAGTISWSPHQSFQTKLIDGVEHIHGNIGGIGQGGGGSPVGWLAVLLVMIATYSLFASGIAMSDPQSLLCLTTYIISYVDDNTLVQSFGSQSSMKDILNELNMCITRWHDILRITGGDLALEKCTFCVMKWRWSQGRAELETPLTDPGELDVMGTTITRLKPSEGTRVLGVRLAMDGTFANEFEYRLQQSKTMAAKLYQSHLSSLDSYMVYETRFRPALEYPLRVTTFTTTELESIQKPFTYLLLPKIGLNRHMPRDVVYGPLFRGGLGLVNLEEQQIIKHFDAFQGHLRRNDDIGKSIRIQLATQQLEIGCGEFFLNTDPSIYSYGTGTTRLSYLWTQCFRFNIKVSVRDSWHPSGEDGTRCTIMDFAAKSSKYSGNMRKLFLLNSCRLYLKLMWPSDLLQADSEMHIDRRYISGSYINDRASLDFPNQGMPSAYAWTLWKEFIYASFCIPKKAANGDLLLQLVEDRNVTTIVPTLPTDFACIIASISGSMTLQQRFTNLPPQFKHIIGNITLPEDEGNLLLDALRGGTAVAASDGSYLEQFNKGSHAYKIVDKENPTVCIQGASMCPESDRMSSSPAEHYGAISVLLVLIVLLHHHDAAKCAFPILTVLIDNEEVVNRGNQLNTTFLNVGQYLTHDYDLWRLMSHLQIHLNVTINFEWIKGHQINNDQPLEQFSVDLNTQVDSLATDIYEANLPIPQRGFFLSGHVCFHQEGYHVQNIANAISSRESDQRLLDYYRSKGWTTEALQCVDWIAIEKFLKTQSPTARCTTIKLMHNWQNTGYQKSQFSGSDCVGNEIQQPAGDPVSVHKDSQCPLGCGCTEYPFHFMQCKHDTMYASRSKGIATLTKGLKKIKTAPSLLQALIQGIRCWTDDTEYDLDETSDPLLFDYQHTLLLKNQYCIGWDSLLKGFLTKEWRYIQGSYYKFKKLNARKYNRDRWVLQVQLLLHQYRFDLWMIRNASIHGGSDPVHGKVLRHRLLAEVKELYARDRTFISMTDAEVFKLPLTFRLKQGNQQLLLWIKHAHMIFDRVDETIPRYQQLPITEWLTNWTDDLRDSVPIPTQPERPTEKVHKQTDIVDWLERWNGINCDSDSSFTSLTEDATDASNNRTFQISCPQDTNRDIVADGTHQCDTSNTCVLVT